MLMLTLPTTHSFHGTSDSTLRYPNCELKSPVHNSPVFLILSVCTLLLQPRHITPYLIAASCTILTASRFRSLDAEQLKQWSNVLGLTDSKNTSNTPQSGYTQTIYGAGTTTTAQLVGYSAQGVGHTVPQHPDMDIAFFGLA